tara:strand:+ start:269 stop:721 length:453 start_codon:yes stop_codon:yes gene_type:complete
MKNKTKSKEVKWTSGINPKSNMSYEKYIKSGLEILSKNLSLRTYKLAPKNDYPMFERGKDLRVQIYWIKESKYEFIIEQSFWYKVNGNKEDRSWMRNYADVHLKIFHDAIKLGREAQANKKSSKKTKTKAKAKKKIGLTQNQFDNFKKKK